MKVLCSGRKTGRTSLLIHEANEAGKRGEIVYIVCKDREQVVAIADKAKELGFNINYPITFQQLIGGAYATKYRIAKLYIDNADHFLRSLTSIPIEIITLEKEEEEDADGTC